MNTSLLRIVLLAAVVVLITLPASATGQLKPIDLSRGAASASSPRIASDGSGNIVAVWREVEGDASAIRAAVRPAGGTWSAPEKISAQVAGIESPELAVDRLGNAVAVWQRSTGDISVVQSAVRPAGGAWSEPQDLSAPTETSFNADVALKAARATAVWTVLQDRRTRVESSSRPINGSWSPALTLSGPVGNASTPVVAVDDGGGAVAAWRWADGAFLVVQGAVRTKNGVWSAPSVLSGLGRSASQPQVAMDSSGNAIVGWLRFNGSWTAAQVAPLAAAGTWGPARTLSERGGNARRLDLVMNTGGDAVVTWTQSRLLSSADLWASFRPAGSARWTGGSVTDSWFGLDQRVALDERGNATVVWAGSETISASFKPVGEAWQPNYLLSDYENLAAQPAVTTQRAENATAVWVGTAGSRDVVQSVSYDVNTYKEFLDEDEGDEGDDEGGDDEFAVQGRTFRGTPGSDTLVGTPGSDVFYGYAGRDVIDGRGGRDIVYGGRGRDLLIGGGGSDRLIGGDGSDRLIGGRGRDLLRGGLGSDFLAGNRGRDVLYGAAGFDEINGGLGRDTVYGGLGADKISGGGHADRIFGGFGRDQIRGDGGSDMLSGGNGPDLLDGGSGNDVVRARDRAADIVLGGTGLDFYSLDRWLDHARSIESRL